MYIIHLSSKNHLFRYLQCSVPLPKESICLCTVHPSVVSVQYLHHISNYYLQLYQPVNNIHAHIFLSYYIYASAVFIYLQYKPVRGIHPPVHSIHISIVSTCL